MTDRRIVLAGFMGCGKTCVAGELARRLDCDFIDLDTFITKTRGCSPAEIVQKAGEPGFRAIETDALEQVLSQTGARIIALGGGTWTLEANRTLIARENCLSVWMDAPFELCWKRIVGGGVARPLAPNRETAKARYESRIADYALAERRVAINGSDTAGDVAEAILKLR
jgi:shikimate kinase